ncbi:MAG: geranylgeranylglycerol-phosphate geranylgeranyltransferase [Euryarchaeota archaeon]
MREDPDRGIWFAGLMRARVYAYIAEIRPVNCLMAAFAALIGIFVGRATLTYGIIGPTLLAFVVVFLVTAGGNVINDYYDVAIDKVNKPRRALPSGRITRKAALFYALTLLLLGVAASVFINPMCFGLATLNAALLVLYSWKLKQSALIGNLLVGYLTGSVFLFGGAAISTIFIPGVLFLSATLAITSREIVKDVEDLTGDKRAGASTLPIRYGVTPSLTAAAFFMLAAVAISPLPFIISALGYVYLGIVFVADVILLYGVALSRSAPSTASKLMKYGMLVVLVAYVLGGI